MKSVSVDLKRGIAIRRVAGFFLAAILAAIPATEGWAKELSLEVAVLSENLSLDELEALVEVFNDDEDIISGITVTAQKRSQKINEVPVSLNAYSSNYLAENAIVDIHDLDKLVPSLIIDHSQTIGTTNLAIRGIGTPATNYGLESSVGVYVDGVYRARQSSVLNLFNDYEAVEILRGPQGTLFGKNTPSGALLFRSAKPVFESFSRIKLGVGNHHSKELAIVNSGPLSDRAAYRVSAVAQKRDGLFDDILHGEEALNDRDRSSVKAQLLWKLTDNWQLLAIADSSRLEETCCAAPAIQDNLQSIFIPAFSPGSDLFISGMDPFSIGLSLGLDAQVTTADQFNKRLSTFDQLPTSTINDYGFSLETKGDFADADITSLTAYRVYRVDELADVDFTTLDLVTFADEVDIYSFSQELHVDKSFGDRFSVLAGLYYYNQKMDLNNRLGMGQDLAEFFNIQPLLMMSPPVFSDVDLAGQYLENEIESNQQSWAAFFHSEYKLTNDLAAILGLRYTREEKDFEGRYSESGVWPVIPGIALLNPRSDASERFSFNELTGTFKLSWQASENAFHYGSFATGFKSGGANTQRIADGQELVFDPEKTDSIELGTKIQIPDHKLMFNLALFRAEVSDYQSEDFNGVGFILANSGSLLSQGIELDLSWRPLPKITYELNYAFTDSTFDELENGTCWVAYDFHTMGAAAMTPDECDRSGDRVRNVPRHTASNAIEYKYMLGNEVGAFSRLRWNYVGSVFADDSNDPLKEQGSFSTFDLELGFSLEEGKTDIVLWAKNLTDRLYHGAIFDTPDQAGKLNAYVDNRRTFGLNIVLTLE